MQWRFGFLVVIAASLLACAQDAPPPSPARGLSPAASCDEVGRWIEDHRAALPTNLDALSAYPLNYRRRIYDASPREVKVAFWRAQLSGWLTQQTHLSDDARRTVEDVIARLPQELDAPEGLEARLMSVLDEEAVAKLIVTLGPGSDGTANLAAPSCSCSRSSDWCYSGVCRYGICSVCEPANCTSTESGCGTFWSYSCDGKCVLKDIFEN